MKNRNRIPRQAEHTWRLVIDFTDEQALEYRRIMGENKGTERILQLMRIGKAQEDGYVYIEELRDSDWKAVEFTYDGKTTKLYKPVDVDV